MFFKSLSAIFSEAGTPTAQHALLSFLKLEASCSSSHYDGTDILNPSESVQGEAMIELTNFAEG